MGYLFQSKGKKRPNEQKPVPASVPAPTANLKIENDSELGTWLTSASSHAILNRKIPENQVMKGGEIVVAITVQ